eukprot:jgi/Botrbrau1/23020/Bobra.136_1s0012.2
MDGQKVLPLAERLHHEAQDSETSAESSAIMAKPGVVEEAVLPAEGADGKAGSAELPLEMMTRMTVTCIAGLAQGNQAAGNAIVGGHVTGFLDVVWGAIRVLGPALWERESALPELFKHVETILEVACTGAATSAQAGLWMEGMDLGIRVCGLATESPTRVSNPKAGVPDAALLAALKFLRRCLEGFLHAQKPLPDQALGLLFDPSSPLVLLRAQRPESVAHTVTHIQTWLLTMQDASDDAPPRSTPDPSPRGDGGTGAAARAALLRSIREHAEELAAAARAGAPGPPGADAERQGTTGGAPPRGAKGSGGSAGRSGAAVVLVRTASGASPPTSGGGTPGGSQADGDHPADGDGARAAGGRAKRAAAEALQGRVRGRAPGAAGRLLEGPQGRRRKGETLSERRMRHGN